MKYDVVFLPSADREIDKILTWLYKASPSGAATWYRRWEQVVASLKESADGYSRAPEDEDHDLKIQHVIFKTTRGSSYRAIFTIRDKTVFLLHMRGPGQDIMTHDDINRPE